jgi:hypothetical protein
MSSDGRFEEKGKQDATEQSIEELETEIELLIEENQQLRQSYTQAKKTQYRRTAIGLGAVGALAVAGGLLIPNAQTVLFSLAAIGLFGGVLTYYLTPERFVSADVGRDIYATLSGNEADLVAELGLTDTRVYVPMEGADVARLFIPHTTPYELPDSDALSQTIVVGQNGGTRGVAFDPSGQQLYEGVREAVTGELASAPAELAEQLTEAIVGQFEIANSASADVDGANGRVSVAVRDSVYGSLDQFDHPIASLFATGLADQLDTAISMEVVKTRDDAGDYMITCRWQTS